MEADEDHKEKLRIDMKVESILRKLSKSDIESLTSAKHNSDRIEIIFRNSNHFLSEITIADDRVPDSDGAPNKWRKSAAEAEKMRKLGNELFAKSRYQESINAYNTAILVAPMNISDQHFETQLSDGNGEVLSNNKDHRPTSLQKIFNEKYITQDDSNENMSKVGQSRDDASKELALAVANRSAALIHMKRFQEAIQDIDYALIAGYPTEARHKLLERRAKVCLHLGRRNEAKRDAAIALTVGPKTTQRRCQEIFRQSEDQSSQSETQAQNCLFTGSQVTRVPPKPEFESFSDAVEVRSSEICGRYTTSKHDIRVGRIIATESPLAVILYPDCHATHCYHCFVELLLPFPCRRCSQVIFCSGQCSESAWRNYHWAECGWMDKLSFDWVGRLGHLAYRILLEAGIEAVFEVFGSEYLARVASGQPSRCQLNQSAILDAEEFATADDKSEESETLAASNCKQKERKAYSEAVDITKKEREPANVYQKMVTSLVRHETERSPIDDLGLSVIAFVLLQISKSTQWLSSGIRKIQSQRKFGRDAASSNFDLNCDKTVLLALLHHLQMIQCNAFEVTEMRPLGKLLTSTSGQSTNLLQQHRIHTIGVGLYPVLATMNHSCDPTVDLVFYGSQSAIRAIRNIRHSEEVTIDYGHLFFIQERSKRQGFLRSCYFFDCRCHPCVEKWPLWKHLPAIEPPLKCSTCELRLEGVALRECPGCRRVLTDEELTKTAIRLEESHRKYVAAMQELRDWDTEGRAKLKGAVTFVEDYLSTMQDLLCLPWRDFYSCQATLRQFYRLMANVSNRPSA